MTRRPGNRIALPTANGDFELHWFEGSAADQPDLALTMGIGEDLPLVRIHSECLTGDVFGSMRCDCGAQLERSMAMITARGCGAVIYLRQEGRGIGLVNKLRAYQLQESGLDTVEANLALGLPAEGRQYDAAIRILAMLGVTRLDLLTNNPDKVRALRQSSLELVNVLPLAVAPGEHSAGYLATKRDRMGHALPG